MNVDEGSFGRLLVLEGVLVHPTEVRLVAAKEKRFVKVATKLSWNLKKVRKILKQHLNITIQAFYLQEPYVTWAFFRSLLKKAKSGLKGLGKNCLLKDDLVFHC